jgi:hypothetical protein
LKRRFYIPTRLLKLMSNLLHVLIRYAQTPNGWVWSLNRDKAIWFAKRCAEAKGATPRLATGTVAKPQVIAYFSGRDEDEIVVDPKRVRNVHKEELTV